MCAHPIGPRLSLPTDVLSCFLRARKYLNKRVSIALQDFPSELTVRHAEDDIPQIVEAMRYVIAFLKLLQGCLGLVHFLECRAHGCEAVECMEHAYPTFVVHGIFAVQALCVFERWQCYLAPVFNERFFPQVVVFVIEGHVSNIGSVLSVLVCGA